MDLLIMNCDTGDSLYALNKSPGALAIFISNLQLWLKTAFGKRFRTLRNSIHRLVQQDSYSCGIITANTIAHAVLGQPLCKRTYGAEARMHWFIRIAVSCTYQNGQKRTEFSKIYNRQPLESDQQ